MHTIVCRLNTRRHYHPGASEKTMNGNKLVYGHCNCAFYNTRSDGDESWFATREERDASLSRLRETAVRNGLGVTAAKAGIYPIRARWSAVRSLRGVGIEMSLDLVDSRA